MSRGKELIKKIDEHIMENSGGLYGLELPDSDLRIIRAALAEKCTWQERVPESEQEQEDENGLCFMTGEKCLYTGRRGGNWCDDCELDKEDGE